MAARLHPRIVCVSMAGAHCVLLGAVAPFALFGFLMNAMGLL